ncbi:MAG: hypothetical protein ACLUML_09435 [Acutalibacteraceae bacterium]
MRSLNSIDGAAINPPHRADFKKLLQLANANPTVQVAVFDIREE